MSTTLINILGSPCSGKSVLGTSLYGELKKRGYETEFVSEVVKPMTYTGEKLNKYSQYTIFGLEARNQSQLFNKVEYILADSALYLCCFYQVFYWGSDSLLEPCKEFYKLAKEDGVKVVNIFIDRKFKYNPKGRFQDEQGANRVKEELLKWLNDNDFGFHYLKVPVKDRIPAILEILGVPEKREEEI